MLERQEPVSVEREACRVRSQKSVERRAIFSNCKETQKVSKAVLPGLVGKRGKPGKPSKPWHVKANLDSVPQGVLVNFTGRPSTV